MPTSKISGMEDLPKSVALQWRKWCLSSDYLFVDSENSETWFGKITCPLVSYSVENDALAPKEAIDWIANRYTQCKKKRIHFKPEDLNLDYIGHSGFFKERNREMLWPLLLKEIEI